MRKLGVFSLSLLILACLVALSPSVVVAFEPTEGLQWDRDKLWIELSGRYFIRNERPIQYRDRIRSDRAARDEWDFRVQYRLLENPLLLLGDSSFIPEQLRLGKLECYGGTTVATGEDAFDRFGLLVGCGYTVQDKVRIEVGHSKDLNFGTRHYDKWGAGLTWWGISGKVFENEDFMIDVYGRHYFSSNVPAVLTNNPIDEKSRLRFEVGSRLSYKVWDHVTLFAAPYALVGDKRFTVERVGVYPGVRYDIGKHLLKNKGFAENIALEAGADLSWNTVGKAKSEQVMWLRLLWELK